MNSFSPLLVLLALRAVVGADDTVSVITSRGTVIGQKVSYDSDDGFFPAHVEANSFRGIPFAKPPIRFQKPQRLTQFPTQPWMATNTPSGCSQAPATGSEDCLYLNIYTPTKALTGSQYPVAVYVHGGGLVTGTADELRPEGAVKQFVANDIILVSIQYRLGILGFFTTDTPEFPGLLGFFDQVEALKWIQDEIKSFGGNPDNVTLLGESGGSISVHALSFSPYARGLFQKILYQSGTLSTAWETSAGPHDQNSRAAELFCQDGKFSNLPKLKECMMSKKADEFNLLVEIDFVEYIGLAVYKVHSDGDFLPGSPTQLAATRPKMPVMIGNQLNELSAYIFPVITSGLAKLTDIDYDWVLGYAKDAFPTLANNDAAIQFIIKSYFKEGIDPHGDHLDWLRGLVDATSAAAMTSGTHHEIRAQIDAGNTDQTFLYVFAYDSPLLRDMYIPEWQPPPVGHAKNIELAYFQRGSWNGTASAADWKVGYEYGFYIANFIKTGKPGGAWTAGDYSTGRVPYFEFNYPTSSMKDDFFPNDYKVWNMPDGLPSYLNVSSYPPGY